MDKIENPIVECQMMIRKPISEVFQAFVDPTITTKFWFTKSSGILEKEKSVTWEWEMYGVSDTIKIIELVPNHLISIEWTTLKQSWILSFRNCPKKLLML